MLIIIQIIVGGGTAGLAVSTRLSQRLPHCTILVIEAGPAAPNELGINIPGKKGSTLGTKYDWNFTTTPQAAVNNRIFSQNRGHVLGGSSAINLLTYDRSSKHEYNSWEELGNHGWGYDDFLEMMNRAENFTSANTKYYGDGDGLNFDGPVRGTINRFIPAQQAGWIPALNSLGIKTNREYLSGNPLGVMYSAGSIDPTHYNRSYSANAYLPLAGPLLTVMTDTKVAKVNLDKSSYGCQATGVTLVDGTIISAKQEIILSAGTFQSPNLLEMSGIGQKNILAAASIKQLVDLPGVGENLQDHIRIQTSYQLKENYTSFDKLRYNLTFSNEQLELWNEGKVSTWDYTGTGYTFQTWPQAIGKTSQYLLDLAKNVVKSSSSPVLKKKLDWMSDPTIPQLEVIFSDGYTGVKGYPPINSTLYGKNFFTLIAAIMHPLSIGNVHINTSSPLSNPIINPNYLSNEHDVQSAIAGIKAARRIAQTPPLSYTWDNEYEPGLEKVQTDAQWRDFVMNTTLTIYHPVGTCAMLPKSKGGVVDSRLRVYGVKNLRVVDASIMPVLISAHMQTAVYGIAEMAAEMIVDDYED